MMFSCGMGIGLVFFGVAEPLYHYVSPPLGTVDGSTPEAIQTAMATSIFHWSIHPWAMFAVVGIAMVYSTFRLGRRQLISSAFTSLFGSRVEGPAGKIGSPVLVGVITVLTICFVLSAVSGISRGIQWLSNINMILALLLAVIVFVLGPTLMILNLIPSAIGDFVRDLPAMASRTESGGDESVRAWLSG